MTAQIEPDKLGDSDNIVYSLKEVATLEGHSDRVWAVAWNPVQRVIASCSADKTVRMWSYNRSGGREDNGEDGSSKAVEFLPATEITTGHRKTVRSIAWSPSGKNLATASFDSSVSVWERLEGDEEEGESLGEWECVSTLEGHDSECKSVAYSNDGGLIASCSRDKSVWIWEVQPEGDFECLSVLMHHTQDVKCVAWHPREELLASASYDDTIILYVDDPSDDWFPFTTLSGHTSTVWSLAFSPCGSLLVSASDDRSLRIWKREPKMSIVGPGQSVRIGAGTSSVTGGKWDIGLVIPNAHDRSIYSVSWSKSLRASKEVESSGNTRDRGWIASTGGDGHIKVWQIEVDDECKVSHKLITDLENAHGVADVNCVAWSTLEPGLLASAGDDYSSKIWSISG
ncbi:Cytosolic iron-sulfur protein assembly protein [Serendipita sp. 401]|nr:Cytosolic iron-sulfur protein assembly protein [Serendipita sp. 401]KAG9058827.1 Cytosolic iron-sulfur protein assembly protein [Serendipita sp. 407]